MLPAIVPIRHKDIVKNHRAQPQHDQFSDIADVEGCVETIVFQALPVSSILIRKRRDVLSKNVAEEPQLEAFVQGIRRNNHFVIALEEENLASFGMREQLNQR